MTQESSDKPMDPKDQRNQVERLDAYADGLLEGREREAFERLLGEDDALRAELDRQRRIDASLGRLFGGPSRAKIGEEVERLRAVGSKLSEESDRGTAKDDAKSGWARMGTSPVRGRQWAVAAGLLVILGLVAYLAWRAVQPAAPHWPMPYAPTAHGDMATVYEHAVAMGFKPGWVCTPEVFRATLSVRFGQPLEMGTFPKDVRMLGLGYADSLSEGTIVMLARVKDQPVMVFIDRNRYAPAELPAMPAGLNVYRRVIEDLVLFEVSPLKGPRVLEHLKDSPLEHGQGARAWPCGGDAVLAEARG